MTTLLIRETEWYPVLVIETDSDNGTPVEVDDSEAAEIRAVFAAFELVQARLQASMDMPTGGTE